MQQKEKLYWDKLIKGSPLKIEEIKNAVLKNSEQQDAYGFSPNINN